MHTRPSPVYRGLLALVLLALLPLAPPPHPRERS
jgi:hypothetical protein